MQPKILSDFCPPLPSAAAALGRKSQPLEPAWPWGAPALGLIWPPLPRVLQLLGG